ncbi:hypothetical protein V8C34DRAFT_321356 [Trichoderma compactum]
MKLSTILTALATLLPFSTADLQVLTGPCSISPGEGGEIESDVVACPSNYYNCDCMLWGDRAGFLRAGDTPVDGLSTTGSTNFQLSGMCGVGNMDFYKQGVTAADCFISLVGMQVCQELVIMVMIVLRIVLVSVLFVAGRIFWFVMRKFAILKRQGAEVMILSGLEEILDKR